MHLRMRARLTFAPLVVTIVGTASACSEPAGPTYHTDIAPLFAANCASCHQAGGIGPFSLVTYDDVKPYAALAAELTAARIMPPMTVDNSGDCRTYKDARWLSDDEIALVSAWAAAGAPEGEPPATPLAIPAIDVLDDANLVVEMAEAYTPKGNEEFPNDDYRCFFLDGPDADAFVNGFEIVAGQPQEVHHMLLFALLTDDAEAQAQLLDDEDAEPGWECFSTPIDEDISLVAGWAPGTNVMRYPEGTGLFVPGGRRMVMQLHYNLLAGPGVPDLTALKLRTIASVEKEGALAPIADDELEVPPGKDSATYEFSFPLVGLAEDLEVHGVFPHMHQLGRTLRFELRPLGATDDTDAFCMTDVQHWDFQWQQLFLYDAPVRVTPADVLHVSCTYDTTSRTEPTYWGEGTQDEMCLVFAYVTRANGGPIADLFEHEH